MSLISRCAHRYGQFIADNPVYFIIGPLILTLLLATGIFLFRVEDDIRFLYSPEGAASRREFAVHERFSGEGSRSTYCALALEGNANNKNILSTNRAKLIMALNEWVLHNMTLVLNRHEQDKKQILHFGRQICPHLPFCPDANLIVEEFLRSYWKKQPTSRGQVDVKYPVMQFYDQKFFLPAHLYGVQTDHFGNVTSVNMVHLIYPIPGVNDLAASDIGAAFERSLNNHLRRIRRTIADEDKMQFSMFSLGILREEVHKNTYYTIPYIWVTVVLLVVFTCVSCMTGDWLSSKPIEGLMGVFSSALSIISAAGVLFLMGYPFISQVAVVPFLALAIGIDDTYIILGAWQRSRRNAKVRDRLGETMSDAGLAITITSITDCLSFRIGAMSNTPAISIFCQFISVAIAFDYLYQITFFPAIVALSGRREAAGYHAVFMWRKVDEATIKRVQSGDYKCAIQQFFTHKFGAFLCNPFTQASVLVAYAAYLIMAIYGCCILRPNLSPSSLVVDDSPLRHYIDLAQNHIWAEGLTGRVYVNQAPDFSKSPAEMQNFMEFVSELESLPYSMGLNSTKLWLSAFQDFWKLYKHKQKDFYNDLRRFTSISFNNQWSAYLNWTGGSECSVHCVREFYFTTGFQIRNWNDRTAMLQAWRAVCARYPEYDALVYDEQNFYSDQTLSLPQTTLQSLGIAIGAMAIVCLLFIRDRYTVFWVIFTLISMDVGVTGFLALWGADLDPTTVVNILMSIGLSIDFSTHVGYRIYRSPVPPENADERIQEAIGAIAWPVIQGGVSTLLAIIVMLCVQSYVVRMFAKTTILVVSFGFLHGLVLLPVLLRTIMPKATAKRSLAKVSPARTIEFPKH